MIIKTEKTFTDITVGDATWRIGLAPSESALRILESEMTSDNKKMHMKKIRVHFIMKEKGILKYLKALGVYLSI